MQSNVMLHERNIPAMNLNMDSNTAIEAANNNNVPPNIDPLSMSDQQVTIDQHNVFRSTMCNLQGLNCSTPVKDTC